MNYTHLMKRARQTNRKRDNDERKGGFTPESEMHPMVQIETAMHAIKAGVVTDSWETVCEGQAILENAFHLMTGRKATTDD